MIGSLFGLALAFGGGLVAGWIFLPEPAYVRAFFVRMGWAKEKAI